MRTTRQICIGVAVLIAIAGSATLTADGAEYRASDIEESIQMLYSDSQEERASSCGKLSEIGADAKSAVPRLIEIVQSDPIMSVRGEAAKALGNIGAAAASSVPALIVFVKDKQGGLERAYAATALGNIGVQPEESVATLIEIVKQDDQPVVRQLSARALGGFGAKATSAVPVLIEAIKTGDKDLRDAACDALAHIPATSRDVPALTSLLSDETNSARLAAARALVGVGSEAAGAVPQLIKLLNDNSDEQVQVAAIKVLGSLGKSAKPALPSLRVAAKQPATKEEAERAISEIRAAQ